MSIIITDNRRNINNWIPTTLCCAQIWSALAPHLDVTLSSSPYENIMKSSRISSVWDFTPASELSALKMLFFSSFAQPATFFAFIFLTYTSCLYGVYCCASFCSPGHFKIKSILYNIKFSLHTNMKKPMAHCIKNNIRAPNPHIMLSYHHYIHNEGKTKTRMPPCVSELDDSWSFGFKL